MLLYLCIHYTAQLYFSNSIFLPGHLPIEVSNAIPADPIVLNVPLPPLPPRYEANNRDSPQPPAPDCDDGEDQPPPISVKASHAMSVLVSGCHSLHACTDTDNVV